MRVSIQKNHLTIIFVNKEEMILANCKYEGQEFHGGVTNFEYDARQMEESGVLTLTVQCMIEEALLDKFIRSFQSKKEGE